MKEAGSGCILKVESSGLDGLDVLYFLSPSPIYVSMYTIHIFTHMYTHMHIYIYECVCMCVCVSLGKTRKILF